MPRYLLASSAAFWRCRKPVPVDQLRRLLDALHCGYPGERGAGQHGERRLVPHDVIPAPNIEGIHSQLSGHYVQQALAQEISSRPRPSVRHIGGLVGEQDGRLGGEGFQPARALERDGDGERLHGSRERIARIGAEVDLDVHSHTQQQTVVGHGGFEVRLLLACVPRRGQMLEAVLHPLDRAAEVTRRHYHGYVLSEDSVLKPECPPDVLGDDPDSLHWHVDLARQHHSEHVR